MKDIFNKKLIRGEDDFYIHSEIERLNYLITASEEHTICNVLMLDESKLDLYSFASTIVLTENEDLELKFENSNNINIDLIKTNGILKIDFSLHGIKIYAECFVRKVSLIKNYIVISISGPYSMERRQRRSMHRVGLYADYQLSLTLDVNKERLSNLLALNISEGGISVLINAPMESISKNLIYRNAEINLPLKMNNHFIVPVKVCQISPARKFLIPIALREKRVEYVWSQVGFKFLSKPPQMEQSLLMVINQVMRNNNNY
ncbi:hypothetical protein GW796_06920 [archaeon]|nr:hypothetical protein [archaeon]